MLKHSYSEHARISAMPGSFYFLLLSVMHLKLSKIDTDHKYYHCYFLTLIVLDSIWQISTFLKDSVNRNSDMLLETPDSFSSQLFLQEPGASIYILLSFLLFLCRTLVPHLSWNIPTHATLVYVSASVGTLAFLVNTCHLLLTSDETPHKILKPNKYLNPNKYLYNEQESLIGNLRHTLLVETFTTSRENTGISCFMLHFLSGYVHMS